MKLKLFDFASHPPMRNVLTAGRLRIGLSIFDNNAPRIDTGGLSGWELTTQKHRMHFYNRYKSMVTTWEGEE